MFAVRAFSLAVVVALLGCGSPEPLAAKLADAGVSSVASRPTPVLRAESLAYRPVADVERALGKPLAVERSDPVNDDPGEYRDYSVKGQRISAFFGTVKGLLHLEAHLSKGFAKAEDALAVLGLDVAGEEPYVRQDDMLAWKVPLGDRGDYTAHVLHLEHGALYDDVQIEFPARP